MIQENKDLLLKDLCARLPYGVKVRDELGRINKLVIGNADLIRLYYNDFSLYSEEKLSLPYLFPLSSMTEEQREELYKIGWYLDEDKIYSCFRNYDDVNYKTHIDCFELINWCYKNNFDINGLIPMGLAIDATGLNIY